MPAQDKPTSEDRFGFWPFVAEIEDMIRKVEERDLPLVIGIYGGWGSGKTSFMYQLRERLADNADEKLGIPTVWFDAWKYDKAYDVRSALIYRVLCELDTLTEGSLKAHVTGCLRILGTLLTSSRVTLGVLGAKVTVPSGAEIAELGDAIGKYQTAVDELEEALLLPLPIS